MENKDLVISNALKEIEKKKKEFDSFKPEEFYRFKTNCRFDDKNIKTLPLEELLQCYHKIYQYREFKTAVTEKLPFLKKIFSDYDNVFNMQGFHVDDWLSDIEYLLKKLAYKEAIGHLENSACQLERFYSKDKQDEIAIDNILSSLKLK